MLTNLQFLIFFSKSRK